MTPLTTTTKIDPPQYVQVGPYKFTINLDKKLWEKSVKEQDEGDLYGLMLETPQQILADPEQGPDMLADTLLHEVLHVIFMISGARERKKFSEEQIVSMISPLLLDTMRRNPEFVAYLLEVNNEEHSVSNSG